MIDEKLLAKYNVPVPRYTSYPTVPNWKEGISTDKWIRIFKQDFIKTNSSKGISLYIHLPFCESLCTYCGCNKKITTNHNLEAEYIAAILKEWRLYLSLMAEVPIIRELHLGGGTPTFFSPDSLSYLLSEIFKDASVHADHEFSFEGHPNNTTKEHLAALYDLGFRRVSYGVQDTDLEVQRIINRMQPFENVRYVTETARSIGYKSVNFDLIYGLPLQSVESISCTLSQALSLRPDRIAFYSYAHVPWSSRGQRLFDENDLPAAQEKMKLYQAGERIFRAHGYHDIGMDHFALAANDLYIAGQKGELHRNFMGYTTHHTDVLLGLGVSSISSTDNAFVQNAKTIHSYYGMVNNEQLAVEKGFFLSKEDKSFGRYILDVSCTGHTRFRQEDMDTINYYSLPALRKMEQDGLLLIDGDMLTITATGKSFIRNICGAFDLYLLKSHIDTERRIYSNSI